MIKDKLIEKQKELIIILKRDKAYLFNNKPTINKIEQLESEITELEKQAEEPSKGAEEILFPLIWNKFKYKNNDPFEDKKLLVTIILNNLLQAMEQYRAEGLRDELNNFKEYLENKKIYDPKEEILDQYSDYGKLYNGEDCFVIEYTDALQAMEQYRAEGAREELISFMVWYNRHFDVADIERESKKIVDKYLSNKQKP
jgi:hypothetical protein